MAIYNERERVKTALYTRGERCRQTVVLTSISEDFVSFCFYIQNKTITNEVAWYKNIQQEKIVAKYFLYIVATVHALSWC